MSNKTEKGGLPAAIKNIFNRNEKPGKKPVVLAGIVALAVTMVFGYRLYVQIVSHESTEDAFVEARVVSISPRVSGHLARVLIDDNQKVKKGDLLAEVDSRDFEVALNIARARLQSAAAAKKEAEATVSIAQNKMVEQGASLSSTRASLEQARAGVAEVVAGHNRDESDLQRMKKIADAGAVSRQEYDHARAQASMSKAQLNSAKKQVDTEAARIAQAKASVGAAENELQQAYALVEVRDAELHEAEAEVERAELKLSYTRITAPCDGYVTKKAVEPGSYVQVGQKLFAVVNRDVWVVANFKETQIADMRPGQPVAIEVDAYPDVEFKGYVDSIQRGTGSRFTLLPPENATGNFIKVVQRVPVKIVLDTEDRNADYLLAPGMSVVPSVNVAARPDAPMLSAKLDTPRNTAVQ